MAATPKKNDRAGGGIGSLFREAGAKAKQVAEEIELKSSSILVQGSAEDQQPKAYKPRIFSILEYIEASWGLAMNLYPAQRFLVKLYYNLPLEDKLRTIEIRDMFNTKTLYNFTEKEYLRYLYTEGRCNIGEQDHERRELCLAIGRRAGKTTLSGIFASYEVYRLLNLKNPQEYYGLPNGNRIQIISVATDKDQAGLLFNEVTTHLAKCQYFEPHVANNTQSLINFRTPYDIERYGPTERHQNGKFVSFNGKASLRVTFKSCIAKGLRGAGNIIVILDEVAHFQDKGQSSAEAIYNAITPSTAAFSPKNQDTGLPIYGPETPTESRIILISSPLNKTGKFYELFHLAMSRGPGSENLLAIQAPTWEINPTVPSSYYRQKFHADPANFMVEHGAQFSDRVRGWIEREQDLMSCVDRTLRPKPIGIPRAPYQMGIDIGLMKDGTAIFITHCEGDLIVVDYHELWVAGTSWRESNPHLQDFSCEYAKTLANVDRLDFEEIGNWIAGMTRKFHISDGLFDRWNGIPLEQNLLKRGLTQFKSEFFPRDLTSKMYQSCKMLMFDQKLRLYDYPTPEGTKHSLFINELLNLQAQTMSRNIVIVGAPESAGHHDDMSDAFVRAVWLSAERMRNEKHIYGAHGVGGAGTPSMTAARYHMMRARKHGGFGERTIPKSLGIKLRRR